MRHQPTQNGSSSELRRSSCVTCPSPLSTTALTMFLLLIIGNLTVQPLTEPDFGWHLRTGLDLLQHGGTLPVVDPYSHTMPNWPWVEHAWLTDFILGGIYTGVGGAGVILFFAFVMAGAWVGASVSVPCGTIYRLLACTLSLWVALPFLGARTQMVTLLGLAVVFVILQKSRKGEDRSVWLMVPLFLLWANLHGGFPAGLLWLGLVLIGTAMLKGVLLWAPGLGTHLHETPRSWTAFRRLLMVSCVAAVVTLVNPYGWRLHGEIVDSLSNQFMLDTLQEWQPVSWETRAGRSFAFYLGGLGLAGILWYRRLEPVRWMGWFCFLFLSLRHMRNIPFFLLVTLPLCAELLEEGVGRLTGWLSLNVSQAKRCLLALTLAGGFFLAWLGPNHLQRVVQSGLEPREYFKGTAYPIEAVQWIREHRSQVGTRLYNDYVYGGFLLWWLPDEKIFIDGRMPAWRSRDRWVFRDYVALSLSTSPRLSILDDYLIDWALVERQSILDEALTHAPAWQRAYEDTKVVIYVHAAQ